MLGKVRAIEQASTGETLQRLLENRKAAPRLVTSYDKPVMVKQ